MTTNMIQGLIRILNEAYGDNSMTPLDRVAANKIVQYFQSEGWFSPDQVALIVEAAGGSVFVSVDAIEDSDLTLKVINDFERDGFQFNTINPAKAKVNPDAESRNVKSGPIKVKPTPKIWVPGEDHP